MLCKYHAASRFIIFFFISVWRKRICFFLYFIQGSIDAYKNSKLNTFPSSLRKIYSNWNRCIWIGKMFFSHSFFLAYKILLNWYVLIFFFHISTAEWAVRNILTLERDILIIYVLIISREIFLCITIFLIKKLKIL